MKAINEKRNYILMLIGLPMIALLSILFFNCNAFAAGKVTFVSEEGYLSADENYTEVEAGKKYTVKGVMDFDDVKLPSNSGRPGYSIAGWTVVGSTNNKIYVKGRQVSGDNEESFGEFFCGTYTSDDDLTFKAVWEKAYKITFQSEEGYLENTYGHLDEIESGKKYTGYVFDRYTVNDFPYSINRSHYVLKGWRSDQDDKLYVLKSEDDLDYNEESLSKYVPTKDTVFTAVWADAYELTFQTNEGEGSVYENSVINIEKGKRYDYYSYREPKAGRIGYALAGWECDGKTYDIEIYNLVPQSDMTFTALWNKTYTVKYYCDGEEKNYSNFIEGKSFSGIFDNNYFIKKEGYILVGWTVRGDESETVYVNNEYGELPEGYKYYDDLKITKDMEVEAVYREGNKYSVTFKYGVSASDQSTKKYEVEEGKTIESALDDHPKDGDYTGYVFKGWRESGDSSEKLLQTDDIYELIPTKDVTYEAVYSAAYNITYDYGYPSDDFKPNENKKSVYQVEKGLSLYVTNGAVGHSYYPTNPDRKGYVFLGWKNEENNNIYCDFGLGSGFEPEDALSIKSYTPESDVTFTAVWKEAYKVTFYTEVGYCSGNSNQYQKNVLKDSNIPVDLRLDSYFYRDDVDKSECLVSGWKLKGDESGYIYDFFEEGEAIPEGYIDITTLKIDSDKTFVAQWSDVYTIKFVTDKGYYDDDNGHEQSFLNIYIPKGKAIAKNYIEPRGLEDDKLIGFTLEGDNKGIVYSLNSNGDSDSNCIKSYIPDGNVEFHAVFKKMYKVIYTVEDSAYWDNDGLWQSIYYGENEYVTYYPNVYYREGYTFVGWQSSVDSKTYVLFGEESCMVTAPITFTAKWKKNDSSSDTSDGHSGDGTQTGGQSGNTSASQIGTQTVTPAVTTTETPDVVTASADNKTTFSIKNKAKIKSNSKITVKDNDKIKSIKLNSKKIKIKANKKSIKVNLKTYKKYLKKKSKWNKLIVVDNNGKKTTLKFKIK